MTHIKAPTLFPREIIIFQGVLTKFHILMKFPHLETIVDSMKDQMSTLMSNLMSTKAFCPCGGGSNLILGTGTENHIFILRTPAAINFFHQILKK